MKPRRLLVPLVVVAVVLLPGCGGDNASTQESSTTTAQATAFRSAYEPVVGEMKGTAIAVVTAIKGAGSQSNAQLQAAFSHLAKSWQDELAKLEALTPPSDVAVDFHSLDDAGTRAESDLNAIVAAAETNDVGAAKHASALVITDLASAKAAAVKLGRELETN